MATSKDPIYGGVQVKIDEIDGGVGETMEKLHRKHVDAFKGFLSKKEDAKAKEIRAHIEKELSGPVEKVHCQIKVAVVDQRGIDELVCGRVITSKFLPWEMVVKKEERRNQVGIFLGPRDESVLDELCEEFVKTSQGKDIMALYKKHMDMYRKKMDTLEDRMFNRFVESIPKAMEQLSPECYEFAALTIAAEEYFDEDVMEALRFSIRRQSPQIIPWEISRFDHSGAENCTIHTKNGTCVKGCTYTVVMELDRSDYDKNYIGDMDGLDD